MKKATTVLILCVISLCALGIVVLTSASVGQSHARYAVMQPIWLSAAIGCGVLAAAMDYRWYRHVSWAIYLLAVLVLVLVLVPGIGEAKNGARRWLDLGPFQAQPSEFAKLALVIALAHYGEAQQRRMHRFSRGVVLPGALLGLLVALVFAEPDWGTAMLMGAVGGLVLLVAGTRWAHVLPVIAGALAAVVVALLNNPLRLTRVLAWLDPEGHKAAKGYQVYQAGVALGSGGWFGRGLGNARQKLGFVPEHQTDFILSVVGEELGLIATLCVVLLFIGILFSGLYIAWNARDTFGTLLAAGLTFLIGLQAFINMGVVTGILPNKGMPLPFLSYGGSSLIVMGTAVGLILSVASRAHSGLHRSVVLPEVEPIAAGHLT